MRRVPRGVVPVLIVLAVSCGQTSTPAPPPTGTERAESERKQGDGALRRPADVLELETLEGKKVRFEGASSASFGPKSTRILVVEADGLEPRVASCSGVSTANFHRDAPLGHHFQPELIDLKDALGRTKEIVEEVSYWPRCPMTWEVQDAGGANYRYCARKKGEATDPPRPSGC